MSDENETCQLAALGDRLGFCSLQKFFAWARTVSMARRSRMTVSRAIFMRISFLFRSDRISVEISVVMRRVRGK